MVSCKQCGAPIDSAASFCRSCGSAQPAANAGSSAPAQAQPAAATSYAPAPVVAKKKSKKALKIVGIVVGVFVALVVWGAIIDAGKNGGRAPVSSQESGDRKSAPAPAVLSDEEKTKEGHLMCAEIQLKLKDYLKGSIKDIQCQPATEGDGVGLVVAYPLPLFAQDNLVRKNTLFMTFSIAGSAVAEYPKTSVKTVYAMDSSNTIFAVPGDFAQQIYTKIVNKELSESDANNEVARTARRVKFPKTAH